MPYLRGFGATRFLSTATPRSGQQAALGNDLRELMDALSAQRAVLAGYDWGGRAACIVSALWPERVRGLVTANSYNIQDIPNLGRPASPEQEHRLWYQYYFSTERGRAGLEANRKASCRLLWKLWSPHWGFDDATFERSARSFDNPDFVAVTIQSIAIVTAMRPATRRWKPSSDVWRRSPRSRCRPSPCRARPTVCTRRKRPRTTAGSSPDRLSAAFYPKSGTIPRGKRQRPSRMQFLNYSKARPDNLLLPPSIRYGSTTPCGLPTDIVRGC